MSEIYCAVCGTANPQTPCVCGATATTDVPLSQEPCAYCGRRPTWRVDWDYGEGVVQSIWLCAECDERETASMDD